MALNTVTNQFRAAMGIEHLFALAAIESLTDLHVELLKLYRAEAQVERARLLRQNPLDYRAVRAMDRELEEVRELMHRVEMERLS